MGRAGEVSKVPKEIGKRWDGGRDADETFTSDYALKAPVLLLSSKDG